MVEKIIRRDFLKRIGKWSLSLSGVSLANALANPTKALAVLQKRKPVLGIAAKGNPESLTRKAVELIGGMKNFINQGDKVFLKPNITFNSIPEQAANVNPEVLRTVILMCLESGASEVRIADYSPLGSKISYVKSGAVDIVSKLDDKRVNLIYVDKSDFQNVEIVNGKSLKSWPIYRGVFEADKFINLPIAKHHSLTGLTLGMKNIMGILGENRGNLHANIHQNLVDLHSVIRADLTIMDCFRILKANGPGGGSLRDVANPQVVIAGADPVAVDSFSATLFGRRGEDVGYIRIAGESGLGEINLERVDLRKASPL